MTKETIGIILPALNEEVALKSVVTDLINVLESNSYSFRIIIVNDGSTDNTGFISEQLKASYPTIDVIHNSTPLNIGTCYRNGAKLLNTEFITWLPTDGEIDTNIIPTMLKEAASDKIIIPYPSIGKGNRSLFRRSLSLTYIKLMNKIFGFNLKYFNGNAIIPSSIIKDSNFISTGFTINLEIIIFSIKKYSLKSIEVPFTLKPRIGGEQKALSCKNIFNVLRSTIQLYKHYHD